MILVVIEHDRGEIAPGALEALTAACRLAEHTGRTVEALTIGADADGLVPTLGKYGAAHVHQAHDELLTDYGPELWGAVVTRAVEAVSPSMVLACGTDRGNEVLAHAAARLDVAFVANCVSFGSDDEVGDSRGGPVGVTRVRWGGSLLEDAVVDAPVKLLTVAHHAYEATPATSPFDGAASVLPVDLDADLARSRVSGRVDREAGLTLATAPVVVSGGRGVGSAEGFAPLEELAAELGGVVGCSRVVTNNGWRNHTDQVGQTGTRIAPQVYIPCGISGAIQHWVGAMASKHIIAINTDQEANMMSKADYAVLGDLHQIVPAITAEIRRRRSR